MQFKYISLNVWWGGNLMEPLLAFLKKEQPDILACQEVYHSADTTLPPRYQTTTVFKRELGFNHCVFAPLFKDAIMEGRTERGNAIFSKFPLKECSTTFFDVPYNKAYVDKPGNAPTCPMGLQHAEAIVGDAIVDIFNIHGIWGTNGQDNERRLAMSAAVVGEVQGCDPAILSGDFNVQEKTASIAMIEYEMKNVFKGELKTTFNLNIEKKKTGGFDTAVVDHLFVSSSVRVIEHHCPQVGASDHLPLVALLEI